MTLYTGVTNTRLRQQNFPAADAHLCTPKQHCLWNSDSFVRFRACWSLQKYYPLEKKNYIMFIMITRTAGSREKAREAPHTSGLLLSLAFDVFVWWILLGKMWKNKVCGKHYTLMPCREVNWVIFYNITQSLLWGWRVPWFPATVQNNADWKSGRLKSLNCRCGKWLWLDVAL